MSDPGLPPKAPSLNLLASLVKEEETKADPPIVQSEPGSVTRSQEYYDVDKQLIARETSASSFKEFKMKGENIPKSNASSGFKGKKISKPRSNSSDAATKGRRPFSADYNLQKRNRINSAKSNTRPKSSKGARTLKGRGSPAQGQRPRSPHAYSSDTSYSSDPEYMKTNTSKKGDNYNPDILKKEKTETDSFFDSDTENRGENANSTVKNITDSNVLTNGSRLSRKDSKSPEYTKTNGSNYDGPSTSSNGRQDGGGYKRDSSTSDTYTSDDDDSRHSDHKQTQNTNGHYSRGRKQQKSTSENVNRNGERRDSDEKMVVVEDYSSSFTSSDDEQQPVIQKETPKPKKKEPLLKRKKKQSLKVFHMSPDQYLETKLHQKYCELEELMNCSFVDQKTHVTRYHLYQMELLNNQYQNVSHGRPSSAVIIPRSLPGDVRQRANAARPGSAKRPSSAKIYYHREGEIDTSDNAYGTLRSVMAAEHARRTNKIRTDINADRPPSGKKPNKKKKLKIEAKLRTHFSDEEEEDISEKPSVGSRGSSKDSSRSLSQHDTPRSGPHIDHHIKYTDNEKLKKWLKEKDKLFRKQVKEEKQRKRQEREKLINEANDKLERHIKSNKLVKKWMREKDKELRKRLKEQDEKNERDLEYLRKLEVNLPGDAMKIRPQSAPSTGRSDNVEVDKDNLKGEKTPGYVKDQIHQKREIEEENRQARKAVKTDPHPPQTKFIYKRPVAGKIKLKMEVRGKSPVAREAETEKKDEEEKGKEMRMSYDDWLKKKRNDDVEKKSKKDADRKKELAKSDPELDRMIPDIAKKRIEDKLNSKKRVNTGIKKFDDRANKSFGGADFGGEIEARPKSPYRLEGDTRPTKRPSTAPASRGRVPHPTKSASSPRKAIIPQKVDKVMANNDQSNPYTVPFPPEKGIPKHVASRQKRIFADRITDNLNEIEQRALMNSELIKEGLSEYAEGYDVSEQKDEAPEPEADPNKRPKITDMMYSPRKREDSSDSSDNEVKPDETEEIVNNVLDDEDQNTVVSDEKHIREEKTTQKVEEAESLNAQRQAQNETNKDNESGTSNHDIDDVKTEGDMTESGQDRSDNDNESKQGDNVEKSMYRSFDNLNELTINESKQASDPNFSDDSNDTLQSPDSTNSLTDEINAGLNEGNMSGVNDKSASKIEVVTDNDDNQNLVGILKESKKSDEIPVPESSGEPTQSGQVHETDDELLIPRDGADSPNRNSKRVSFNEKTEVFQSFESSTTSTDTVTPEPAEEFNADWESLESYPDEPNDEEEKVSFNIAGFELNPVILNTEEKQETDNNSTFITDPDNSTA